MRITVTFDTDETNTALPSKVVAGVQTMLNEGGLDHHPTDGAGPFHDLTVIVTDDRGQPIWGSVFEGAANNEDEDEDDDECTGTGKRVVEEIGHGTRTVAGTVVRVTELVWDDGGRSFEVHRQDDGTDLTTDQCFDALPTDAQIAALLPEETTP